MIDALDPIFIDNLKSLTDVSREMHQQHKTGRGGIWSLPPIPETGWQGDLFDFTTMADAFSRADLEKDYVDVIANAILDDPDSEEPPADDVPPEELLEEAKRGTMAQLAAIKTQAAWLSQRERAFRARHATPIMAECFAAARRKGHGLDDENSSGVFGVVLNYTSQILNYGK